MVLRARADLVQLAITANWVCVKSSTMLDMKIEVWRCIATRIRKPT
jgi:hypothetical protein